MHAHQQSVWNSQHENAIADQIQQITTQLSRCSMNERDRREPPPALSLQQYVHYMTNHSQDSQVLEPIYGHWWQANDILGFRKVSDQLQFLVGWKEVEMYERHVLMYTKQGLQVSAQTMVPHEHSKQGATDVVYRVTWQPSWASASQFCKQPIQAQMAQQYMQNREIEPGISLAKVNCRSLDAHKPNIERQGHWIERELKMTHMLWENPTLAKYIHMDETNVIDPEQDIEPTGTYFA